MTSEVDGTGASWWMLAKFAAALVVLIATSLFIGALLALLFVASANAHDAPSGWEYDQACCSGFDCAELPAGAVETTSQGYVVRLQPREHPMLWTPMQVTVAYGAPEIRISRDDRYHACIVNPVDYDYGQSYAPQIRCLYVPPRGF